MKIRNVLWSAIVSLAALATADVWAALPYAPEFTVQLPAAYSDGVALFPEDVDEVLLYCDGAVRFTETGLTESAVSFVSTVTDFAPGDYVCWATYVVNGTESPASDSVPFTRAPATLNAPTLTVE